MTLCTFQGMCSSRYLRSAGIEMCLASVDALASKVVPDALAVSKSLCLPWLPDTTALCWAAISLESQVTEVTVATQVTTATAITRPWPLRLAIAQCKILQVNCSHPCSWPRTAQPTDTS